ncbi:MAG: Holliday junction branch migration protein RuvA [Gammaproteobacteria bacterium]|nr:Holliday junction branch migration protein RuvA [Gammaproteobacteria bacterium]
MIGRLNGVVAALDDTNLLIDVNGVGYDALIPSRLSERLSIGDALLLHTHVVSLNDVLQLYGFDSITDRTVFRNLLAVSRLGPKSAMSLLSDLSGESIVAAIEGQDARMLASVKGIGKQTSETIVFALRNKVAAWGIRTATTSSNATELRPAPTRTQALLALRQLGFDANEAERAVTEAFEEGLDVNAVTQRALRMISTNA